MNILLITQLYPSYQGQSRREITYALHDFVHHWDRSPGISVVVINPSKRIRIKNRQLNLGGLWETSIDGVKVLRTHLWNIPGYRIMSAKPIEHYLDRVSFTPDVIVAHMSLGAEVAALLGKKLRKPTVFALHQGDFPLTKRVRALLGSFSAFAFRSVRIETLFRQSFSPPISFVATSGVEESAILNETDYLANRFHRPLRILSVNTLIALKNIDVVLRALSRLPEGVEWTYTIVGDGEEQANLQGLTDSLNLRSHVSFLGERNRPECLEIMERSDVFVMVSSPETFGLAYLEAMAKGMIVIGAKDTGIDGIVKHRENGFLCTARSDVELSKLLLELIQYDNLERMRAAAFKTIKDYTIEQKSADYLAFLKCTINHPPADQNPPMSLNSERPRCIF